MCFLLLLRNTSKISADMTDTTTTLEQLDKVSIKLMLKEPFFGHYFSHLLKGVNTDIQSLALTVINNQSLKLEVNPDYWSSLTPEQCYGVIKHEMLHIVLKHVTQTHRYQHTKLFNIAADIVVNQFIPAAQLTADAILIEKFQQYGKANGVPFAANKDVGYYYQQLTLLLALDNSDNGGDGCGDDKVDNPLTALLAGENSELAKHDNWQQVKALSEAQRDLLEQIINHSIEQAVKRVDPLSKTWGKLPGALRDYLEDLLANLTPMINWRRIIRLFAASSSKTRIKNTLRRPSKRYGTTPGIKIQPRQKLLVAIDTSGSIDLDSLALFFTEIDQIWRQGTQIRIIEVDTEIQRIYDYRGTPPEDVKGRGGTSFDEAIIYANRTWVPDALLYFTDGYAPAPQIRSRAPILWVISPQGEEIEKLALPGRKLKMSPQ